MTVPTECRKHAFAEVWPVYARNLHAKVRTFFQSHKLFFPFFVFFKMPAYYYSKTLCKFARESMRKATGRRPKVGNSC